MPFNLKAYKRRLSEEIYLNPLARRIYLPFLTLPREKTYIFVLGSYNSGTTLLNEIIGHHTEISMLYTEGIYLTPELKKTENFGWNRMYHKCYDQMTIAPEDAKNVFLRVKKDWGHWHNKSKNIFIEKSVANAIWIEWLEQYFENAYFVWIVRNGYAVSEGIRRRTKGKMKQTFPGKEYPIQMCAHQWAFSNRLIEEKLKVVKNKYFLSYEALTGDPEKVTKELLDWLPVKEKRMDLLESFRFHDETSPIRNMNSGSIKRLSPEDIKSIESEVPEELQKYGYELLGGL
ncbi:MAG: sulfotransferase [bacterium]|nr:sulfotransferase [bacterium]